MIVQQAIAQAVLRRYVSEEEVKEAIFKFDLLPIAVMRMHFAEDEHAKIVEAIRLRIHLWS